MVRRIRAIGLLLAVAIAVPACGGDDGSQAVAPVAGGGGEAAPSDPEKPRTKPERLADLLADGVKLSLESMDLGKKIAGWYERTEEARDRFQTHFHDLLRLRQALEAIRR